MQPPPREGRSRRRKNSSIVDSILGRKSPAKQEDTVRQRKHSVNVALPLEDLISFSDIDDAR